MCEQLCKKCKNDFEMAKTCQSCKHKNQIFYVSSEYLHACAHSKRAIGVRPPIPQSGERFDYFDCCDKHEEEKRDKLIKCKECGKPVFWPSLGCHFCDGKLYKLYKEKP